MPSKQIRNLANLCDYFGADEPRGLNHRIYKDTSCGASLSLYFEDAEPLHNGLDRERWEALTRDSKIRGFTVQTIVEGSDATVDSDEFVLPVSTAKVDKWMKEMEERADRIWKAANCDHFMLYDGSKQVGIVRDNCGDLEFDLYKGVKVPKDARAAMKAVLQKRAEEPYQPGMEQRAYKPLEVGEEITVGPYRLVFYEDDGIY